MSQDFSDQVFCFLMDSCAGALYRPHRALVGAVVHTLTRSIPKDVAVAIATARHLCIAPQEGNLRLHSYEGECSGIECVAICEYNHSGSGVFPSSFV